MNLVTMKDYIYATPAKVLENVKNAEMLVKPIVDLYIKKNYKKITFDWKRRQAYEKSDRRSE